MEPLLSYRDIYEQHNDYLLFGNGLSISIWEEFKYHSLFGICSDNQGGEGSFLSEGAVELFRSFDTTNFEWVLYALNIAAKINNTLGVEHEKVNEIYMNIKKSLISAVHKTHIAFEDLPSDRLETLNKLFRGYSKGIFTTNYDLISYWALMTDKKGLSDLFFRAQTFDIKDPIPNNSKVPLFYLHGALHLYRENGKTKKLVRNSKRLLDVIEMTMSDGNTPIFVSEGTSSQKLNTITSNDYLNHCFKQLSNIKGGITIFGSALGREDDHIVDAIRNSGIKRIAYSIYTGSNPSENMINKATAKIKDKFDGIEVKFFKHDSLFYEIE